jgi:hypothetical protein
LQHEVLDQHLFDLGAKIGFGHDSDFEPVCLDEKHTDVIGKSEN